MQLCPEPCLVTLHNCTLFYRGEPSLILADFWESSGTVFGFRLFVTPELSLLPKLLNLTVTPGPHRLEAFVLAAACSLKANKLVQFQDFIEQALLDADPDRQWQLWLFAGITLASTKYEHKALHYLKLVFEDDAITLGRYLFLKSQELLCALDNLLDLNLPDYMFNCVIDGLRLLSNVLYMLDFGLLLQTVAKLHNKALLEERTESLKSSKHLFIQISKDILKLTDANMFSVAENIAQILCSNLHVEVRNMILNLAYTLLALVPAPQELLQWLLDELK